MLAGQPPFEGENPLAIALQHVNKAPTPLQVLRPDVPQELCQIIERMMAERNPPTASRVRRTSSANCARSRLTLISGTR